jgi:hypothetical protein
MPRFEIPVTWSVSGTYHVEADALEEAKEKVLDAEEPYDKLPKGEYIDDSMRIDEDALKEMNEVSEALDEEDTED